MTDSDRPNLWHAALALLVTNILGAATVYAGAAGNQWKPALTTFLLGLTIMGVFAVVALFLLEDET